MKSYCGLRLEIPLQKLLNYSASNQIIPQVTSPSKAMQTITYFNVQITSNT